MEKNVCIACLNSFGIQNVSIPYQCTNKKCLQNYCAHCIETINKCNGPDRPFQCVFCLCKYPLNKKPKKNELLLNQLWQKVLTKYGFSQTPNNSDQAIMSKEDFQFELECRCYHAKHLLKTLKQFTDLDDEESTFRIKNNAHGMINQLEDILHQVKNNTDDNILLFQRKYDRIITAPNLPIGSFYIEICESLHFEIIKTELRQLFPKIHEKYFQWNTTLGSGDQFQPKINELFDATRADINALPLNPHRASLRTKIGFIGYTSVGKTSLMYRLSGLNQSQDNQLLCIRTTKSTYYPLQYDLDKPWIHPENEDIRIPVRFIDIQGCDIGVNVTNSTFEAGNYLDEIRKADCDIYLLVFDKDLVNEQYQWIIFITEIMKRQCLLVRSKVDDAFLNEYRQKWKTHYAMSPEEERNERSISIIDNLRCRFQVDDHFVFLSAANYCPNSTDAALLLEKQSFDIDLLRKELSRRVPSTRNIRLHNLAVRAVQHTINSCFRNGYVLNVMKYKIATGIAAIIPFADTIPRYLARENIGEVFGITKDFLESLRQRNLKVLDGQLQTSVFKSYVSIITKEQTRSSRGTSTSGYIPMTAVVAGGALADDIARAAIPAVATLPNTARVVLGVATFGVGLVISAGFCAWSAINTGKHIFGYVNRLCDDMIILSIPLIQSFSEE